MHDETELEALALACAGHELRTRFAELELGDLATNAAPSLRLLALWEQQRSFDADGKIEAPGVARFLAALEQVVGQAPPLWWREQLASAKLRPGDEGGPPYYDVGLQGQGDRRGPKITGPGDTRVREGAAGALAAAKGQLSYDLSMGRVALGPLPEPGASIELDRAAAGTTIYWASFNASSGAFRFPLHASSAAGEQWTAEVCGPDRKVLGGLGYLSAEILVLESRAPGPRKLGSTPPPTGVAVFTAESHGLAVEIFELSTGARTLAWSSDFWFSR